MAEATGVKRCPEPMPRTNQCTQHVNHDQRSGSRYFKRPVDQHATNVHDRDENGDRKQNCNRKVRTDKKTGHPEQGDQRERANANIFVGPLPAQIQPVARCRALQQVSARSQSSENARRPFQDDSAGTKGSPDQFDGWFICRTGW
jgi:hypothetical protein